jgi:hypothetical protein
MQTCLAFPQTVELLAGRGRVECTKSYRPIMQTCAAALRSTGGAYQTTYGHGTGASMTNRLAKETYFSFMQLWDLQIMAHC